MFRNILVISNKKSHSMHEPDKQVIGGKMTPNESENLIINNN